MRARVPIHLWDELHPEILNFSKAAVRELANDGSKVNLAEPCIFLSHKNEDKVTVVVLVDYQ